VTISPIHHVVLSVSDIERSVAFYQDALGMRVTLDSPVDSPTNRAYLRLGPAFTGHMTMMQAGPGAIGSVELIQWSPPAKTPTPPKRPGDPGVWCIAFQVIDETLDELAERWQQLGIPLWSGIAPVEVVGYPEFRAALIEDPDGILIEIIEIPSPEAVRAFRVNATSERS
jgi:catechol 2,3-dioxygenase-like lactoylglutathione lyase family enzyme